MELIVGWVKLGSVETRRNFRIPATKWRLRNSEIGRGRWGNGGGLLTTEYDDNAGASVNCSR
uniref:Uncharacterized protein n=1 Tax=Cucumis melo TaxID=3656 RepID=A0A9I9CUB0_CUCME